jgi:hypothetical protein
MFRGKIFGPTLTGHSYSMFIEGLKSPVTKAAYTYALQKYMKYRTHLPSPIPTTNNTDNAPNIRHHIGKNCYSNNCYK